MCSAAVDNRPGATDLRSAGNEGGGPGRKRHVVARGFNENEVLNTMNLRILSSEGQPLLSSVKRCCEPDWRRTI